MKNKIEEQSKRVKKLRASLEWNIDKHDDMVNSQVSPERLTEQLNLINKLFGSYWFELMKLEKLMGGELK